MSYLAYIYGLPRSGNCLLWRTAKYLVGEPATYEDFMKYRFGSILRSHFVDGKPKFQTGPRERSVGIIRDPRDVLVSISRWDTENEEVGPSRQWPLKDSNTVQTWVKRWKEAHDWIKANTTLRIRYEDLIRDFKTESRLLAVMLGVEYPDFQKLIMYAQMSNGHGSGGGVGAWKKALDGKTVAYILDELGPDMEKLGYACSDPVPR